jgi:putative flavoprotein involved in K+ transport
VYRSGCGLARLTIPDLSARSLTRPLPDLYTRVRRDRSVPVHDTGIVRLLVAGAVTPVAAVVGFTPDAVRLADGAIVAPDVVVFATGYRRGLDSLLGGLGLLDIHGEPAERSGVEAASGFYFVGFTVSATGALRQMAGDARRIARTERWRGRALLHGQPRVISFG